MVDLPHWRVQLRMTCLEREARTAACLGSGWKPRRSRAKATGSRAWQMSPAMVGFSGRWGMGIRENAVGLEGSGEALGGFGEVLEGGHHGGAELGPFGGDVVLGGYVGLGGAGVGGELGARAPGAGGFGGEEVMRHSGLSLEVRGMGEGGGILDVVDLGGD